MEAGIVVGFSNSLSEDKRWKRLMLRTLRGLGEFMERHNTLLNPQY